MERGRVNEKGPFIDEIGEGKLNPGSLVPIMLRNEEG